MFFQLTTDIQTEVETSGFFKILNLGQLGTNGLRAAIVIGAAVALAYMVWGALDWIMSEGDKQKLENAKNKITHALIGLAIAASVWAIWSLVQYFLFGRGNAVGGGGNQPNASSETVCQTKCAIKNCSYHMTNFEKNEFGQPGCECIPGPGQHWVQVGNNPYGQCEP